MAISEYPNQQMIKADISQIDLIQIIRVAGHVADIDVLKHMVGGEDTFVFTEAYVYVSTGAKIRDTEYPKGISAGGGLTAFGKSARFDLAIGAAGLDFEGFIDNFSLGPLVVSSASGEPQASMTMRMSKEEQVIKVDGMVTCFGIGFAALVDIQMGTDNPSFRAYLAVQFTDAFKISIMATVEDFHDVKDLALKPLYFKGSIQGDLFDLICESIKKMLNSIKEMGTKGIESLQDIIRGNIADKEREMKRLAELVNTAHEKVEARRQNRQTAMKNEGEKRQRAKERIEELKNDLAEKEDNRGRVEEELKKIVADAQLEREALIRRKRKEYDQKLEDARQEEADNRKKLEDLKYKQRTKYGTDFLKKVETAKGAWWEKKAAEEASWKAVQWVYQQKCEATL